MHEHCLMLYRSLSHATTIKQHLLMTRFTEYKKKQNALNKLQQQKLLVDLS